MPKSGLLGTNWTNRCFPVVMDRSPMSLVLSRLFHSAIWGGVARFLLGACIRAFSGRRETVRSRAGNCLSIRGDLIRSPQFGWGQFGSRQFGSPLFAWPNTVDWQPCRAQPADYPV